VEEYHGEGSGGGFGASEDEQRSFLFEAEKGLFSEWEDG